MAALCSSRSHFQPCEIGPWCNIYSTNSNVIIIIGSRDLSAFISFITITLRISTITTTIVAHQPHDGVNNSFVKDKSVSTTIFATIKCDLWLKRLKLPRDKMVSNRPMITRELKAQIVLVLKIAKMTKFLKSHQLLKSPWMNCEVLSLKIQIHSKPVVDALEGSLPRLVLYCFLGSVCDVKF